jgi:cytochrome c biogenesis protein ResB
MSADITKEFNQVEGAGASTLKFVYVFATLVYTAIMGMLGINSSSCFFRP